MKILLDSNLWISFMIGRRLSSLPDVLCSHGVDIYTCEKQLDEIRNVISREKFKNIIKAETRYYFFEMIYDVCHIVDITTEAVSNIRDPKDLYLLSMAESVPVDYIVSGDKDLTDLGSHAGIPILKYSELLEIITEHQG